MIHFVRPEAFLLGLVVLLLLRRHLVGTWPVTVLRALALLLVLAILAEPYGGRATLGRDLVLVLDRSRSVPESAARVVEEIAARAAREARSGDRMGEVAFGREPVVEHVPVEGFVRTPEVRTLDRDGSDLARAIDAGLALIPPDRPGSLLLLSDGEATGGEAEAAARRAARRNVRIDVVPLRRTGTHDLAVEELSIPDEVAAGEPFQLSAWVRSDRPVEGTWRLERDGVVVAEGRRAFRAGLERVGARDRIAVPGIHEYRLRVVLDAPDRVPENDVARAALRVDAPARVLVVTPGGRADRLTKSLAAGGLAVDVSGAADAPLTLDALDAYRAVILEDVPAEDLPDGGLEALASFVTDLGGGLLMTGGKASFGAGGYHLSPVGEVLPVSLELRQEQRKFALAMAIALDRSGSMAMTVPGGGTKMDLGNRGTCAAIELLTSLDSVAVIAVDSAPHLVVPMGPVKDKPGIFAAGPLHRVHGRRHLHLRRRPRRGRRARPGGPGDEAHRRLRRRRRRRGARRPPHVRADAREGRHHRLRDRARQRVRPRRRVPEGPRPVGSRPLHVRLRPRRPPARVRAGDDPGREERARRGADGPRRPSRAAGRRRARGPDAAHDRRLQRRLPPPRRPGRPPRAGRVEDAGLLVLAAGPRPLGGLPRRRGRHALRRARDLAPLRRLLHDRHPLARRQRRVGDDLRRGAPRGPRGRARRRGRGGPRDRPRPPLRARPRPPGRRAAPRPAPHGGHAARGARAARRVGHLAPRGRGRGGSRAPRRAVDVALLPRVRAARRRERGRRAPRAHRGRVGRTRRSRRGHALRGPARGRGPALAHGPAGRRRRCSSCCSRSSCGARASCRVGAASGSHAGCRGGGRGGRRGPIPARRSPRRVRPGPPPTPPARSRARARGGRPPPRPDDAPPPPSGLIGPKAPPPRSRPRPRPRREGSRR